MMTRSKIRLRIPRLLFLFVLCCSFIPVQGQFQRSYSTDFDEIVFDALPINGSDVLISGTTLGSGCGGSNVMLMRVNDAGDIVWERSWGDNSFEDIGASLYPAGGNEFVVSGTIESSQGFGFEDMMLTLFDANGNLQFTRAYGGTSFDESFAVCDAPNRGFYVVGRTSSFGAGSADIYVVRTDANGNVVWSRTYGGTGFDEAFGVAPRANGGCVVVGSATSFAGGDNLFWMLLNPNGTVDVFQKFTGSQGATAEDIIQTSDGGYAITGKVFGANPGVLVMKLDAGGVIQFANGFASSGSFFDFGSEIEEAGNGDLLVTGTVGDGPDFINILLLRTSSTGSFISASAFAQSSTFSVARGLAVKSNSTLIAGNLTNGDSDAWAIEVDGSGSSDCGFEAITMTPVSVNTAHNNQPVIAANNGAGTTVNPNNCAISLEENDLCPAACEAGITFCYTDYTVTGNEVWTTTTSHPGCGVTADVFVQGTIRIPVNSSLRIDPGVTVHFGEEGRVVLESGDNASEVGGKLDVNGATLTNAGTCRWIGIDVWGNQDFSQFPVGNSRAGYLRVRNNALIENAAEAVRLWRPGDLSRSGGIVRAANSTFRNNWRSAEFMSYQNFFPFGSNPPRANESSYSRVTFETTGPLINGIDPLTHVSMWDVDGVNFRACTFQNTTSGSVNSDNRGIGITSIDARYTVSGICTGPQFPCTSYDNSLFTGLSTGIDAASTMPTRTVNVTRTNFENNGFGIDFEGLDLARITYCTLDVQTGFIGAFLEGCSDYRIEENRFENSGTLALNAGLFIRNSGTGPELVYRNQFENLFVGAIAQDANDGPTLFDGLQLRCNDFTGDVFDIAVSGTQNDQSHNIGVFQGFCTPGNVNAPANNTFSQTCATAESDFSVNKQHPQEIIYNYLPNIPAMVPQCAADPLFLPSACQPLTGVACPEPCLEPDCYKERKEEAEEELAKLDGRVDGGDKGSLLNTVSFGSGSAAYTALGNASPYLSDDVLLAAINSSGGRGMTEAQLLDILVQNSPLSEGVAVVMKTSPALSAASLATLELAQTGVSGMMGLEAERAGWTSRRKDALYGLVGEWLFNDSTDGNLDSALACLSTETDAEARRNVINLQMEKGDFNAAKTEMEKLAMDDPSPENLDFVEYTGVISELLHHPWKAYSLSGTPPLEELITGLTATEKDEQTWRQAMLLLEINFQAHYETEIKFPEPPSKKVEQELIGVELEETELQFYPNPTRDRIFFKGDEFANHDVQVALYNNMGRMVRSEVIRKGEEGVLDLSELPNGMYILKMESQSGKNRVSKVLLAH